MFVNSHLDALWKERGERGIDELEKRCGRPLKFETLEDVPVEVEAEIIDHILDIVSRKPIPKGERSHEAGRLHFRNFVQTSFGKILFSVLPKDFTKMLLKAKHVAPHIFKNIGFEVTETGPQAVKVLVENSGYPKGHFKGLLEEWLYFSGNEGTVAEKEVHEGAYEYRINWKKR